MDEPSATLEQAAVRAPAPVADVAGLTEAEAAARRAAAPRRRRPHTSRSYASIVRANVLTVFNLILAAFGALTLVFGDVRDALFLGIIVANSVIGITQEVRAKHALDRLSLLVAPRATVIRDDAARAVAVADLVVGDLVALAPGDQLVADGTLVRTQDLRLDESILTGESRAVERDDGDAVRSGAFVVEGTALMRVTAVGEDSFAARITGQARSFRHPRSPLERAVNRLLYVLVALVVSLGAVLGYSLYHRHVKLHTAVSTASAGVVTLVPEGLMVLVSLTYAAGAVRMSRHGVLASQLNAIESLASVDTVCIDKTGTLTEATLRVVELLPAPGIEERELEDALALFAAGASSRNVTLQAIADAFPAESPRALEAETPFASRRRWSAVRVDGTSYVLGAPERLPIGALADAAQERQRTGRRVLALTATAEPLPPASTDDLPAALAPLGLVVLAEALRPNVSATIAYLREQHVEVKVLSGDATETVAAIARDVGIDVRRVSTGAEITGDPAAVRAIALETTVVGRISPEGKEAIVRALADAGRYVAMVGDGVNDVPALKRARLAIAQGTGTQMARAVSDIVLVSGDFATIPMLIAEGRRALRNLQRVTKLYVTKSAFAAFLILTIGTSSEAYPLLPRHLSLAASLTIGIPSFFLALAPSSGPWRAHAFMADVARFAVPAGALTGAGLVGAYQFALHDLNLSTADARTVALTTLVVNALYLVMALEAGGSRRRSTLVAAMCTAMAGIYAVTILVPSLRSFFALSIPTAAMIGTALLASAITIAAMALSGYSLRVTTPAHTDLA